MLSQIIGRCRNELPKCLSGSRELPKVTAANILLRASAEVSSAQAVAADKQIMK